MSDTRTTSGNNAGSQQINTISTATTPAFVIADTMATFMRPKTITFSAEGLKPNTQYYPFFDDVYVGQYCSTQSNPTINPDNAANRTAKKVGFIADNQQTLKTNEVGSLVGNFYMPANTFPAGSHTFKLVDKRLEKSGTYVADPIYGSAEALYEANGILKQQQSQVTAVTSPNVNGTIKVTTPVVATNPGTGTPTVKPQPVKVCESWAFTYAVRETAQKMFAIRTNTASPPHLTQVVKPSTGGRVEAGSVVYISTTIEGTGGSFVHKYRYNDLDSTTTFKQEWVGPTVSNWVTDLPSLVNFRPSGISTSAVVTIRDPWRKIGTVACPVNFGLKTPTRVDPLAQSFFVDAQSYPNGIFVTSLGVYFRTVDQSTPVVLELREMVNGLPGSNILPGGTTLVQGRAASSSPDATVSTVFRFDQPVYLRPSTDYCFVLKSTSMGYNTWCSRVGEIDVTTGKVIDTQPFVGSLFKSENDVTWTPDQYEDIKFDLFKADFNSLVTGNLVFRPQADTGLTKYFSTSQTLPLSFISTTKGLKVVGLNIPMHSLSDGDTIVIEGIATPTPVDRYNNIRAENLNGQHTVTVIDEDNVTITVGGVPVASKTGNLVVSDLVGMLNNIPAVMPATLPSQAAVPFVDANNFSPATVPAEPLPLTQPSPPTVTSSNTFTVYTNIGVNEVMIDYIGTEVSQTAIVEHLKIAAGTSTAGTEVPYSEQTEVEIDRNGDFFAFLQPRMIATPQNEANHTVELNSSPSAVVRIELKSTDKDVSPIIDMNGMSLTVRTYKIDNQGDELDALVDVEDFNDPTLNSEIVPGAGTASAKYKSSINTMAEAYNNVALFITGNCTAPAKFDVYIRTSTDASTHADRNWVYVPYQGTFPNSSNRSVTNEWLYRYNTAAPFTVFDVKIVMRSTNNSIVPKIFGVRTIANTFDAT